MRISLFRPLVVRTILISSRALLSFENDLPLVKNLGGFPIEEPDISIAVGAGRSYYLLHAS